MGGLPPSPLCDKICFDGAQCLKVSLGVSGVPTLFLAVPAVSGSLQGGPHFLGRLSGEVDFYAIEFRVDLHPDGGGAFFRACLGRSDPGGSGDEFNASSVVLQTPEIVEIVIEIVDHAVRIIIVEGLDETINGGSGGGRTFSKTAAGTLNG